MLNESGKININYTFDIKRIPSKEYKDAIKKLERRKVRNSKGFKKYGRIYKIYKFIQYNM